MPTPFEILGIVNLPSFLIIFLNFETLALRVSVTDQQYFTASLMDLLFATQKNSFSAYELSHMIPYQTQWVLCKLSYIYFKLSFLQHSQHVFQP